jgi:hypothetical protein|tara:strand:- start:7138 stop:7455 length:318 start_codon:yes stop_codon:yes gene_type:complete
MSKDYIFVEKKDAELYSLKVVQGPYNNVIYTYGSVTIEEDEDKDLARLKFNYHIEEVPEPYSKRELEESTEFRDYIGNILTEILEDQTGQIGNARNTDDNTEIID